MLVLDILRHQLLLLQVVVEQVLVEEIHLRRTREETVENFEVERQRTEVDIDE